MGRHYRLLAIAGLAASLALVASATVQAQAAVDDLAEALHPFDTDILLLERPLNDMDLFAEMFDRYPDEPMLSAKLYYSGVDNRSWTQFPDPEPLIGLSIVEEPFTVPGHRLGAREPKSPPYRRSTSDLMSSTAIDGQHIPISTDPWDQFRAYNRFDVDHFDSGLRVWPG